MLRDTGFKLIKKANIDKFTLSKTLSKLKLKNKLRLVKHKKLYINRYLERFYKTLIKNSLKNLKFYLFYRQLLYINESKYNYLYLLLLMNLVERIYNKKVEFNLINLKYHYLNSDILAESLTLKITKNRKKVVSFLNKLI